MNPSSSKGRWGMGCWQIGGPADFGGRVNGYGAVSRTEALSTVREAYEQGVRFFDTADSYGRGRSEELLGEALAPFRTDVRICTKFGGRETAAGLAYQDFSPAYLGRAVEASLRRLGTDHIDVLLLHGPGEDVDLAGMDRAPFEALITAGKIGAYGVSARTLAGAVHAAATGFGDWVEVVYNALDRRAGTELLPLTQASGMKVIARVPLASGFLHDRVLDNGPSFAADDIRSTMPEDQRAWMLDSVRALAFLADLPGGLAASALRFAAFRPGIEVCIPGMRSAAQVRANAAAVALGPLPSDVVDRIEHAVPEVFHKWRPTPR